MQLCRKPELVGFGITGFALVAGEFPHESFGSCLTVVESAEVVGIEEFTGSSGSDFT
jgi:hypothetical protein